MDRTRLLRSLALFRSVPDDELAVVALRLGERRLARGETIFRAGDPGNALYLIDAGQVQINGADARGQPHVLAIQAAPSVLGEMALLGNRPHSATAQAVTDTRLFVLGRRDFEAIMASHPPMQQELLSLLVARQTDSNTRLMQDQSERAAAPHQADGTIVTVYSSKGGAGKTTVAVNLAVAMARGHPDDVVLVDLALTFGHAALLLDVQPRCGLPTGDAESLANLDATQLAAYLVPHPSGLLLLQGTMRPEDGERVRPVHVVAVLRALRQHWSRVVVDTSSDFTDNTLAALEAADRVVYVVTPEVAAVRDLVECERIFRDTAPIPEARFYYLLNRPNGTFGLEPAAIERTCGHALDSVLPYGGEIVMRAAQCGQPFTVTHPNEPLARAFDRIATDLVGPSAPTETGVEPPVAKHVGVFSRLFRPADPHGKHPSPATT